MTLMREFCGWLSADITELHSLEVPKLAESLDRFFAMRHLCDRCGQRKTWTALAPVADSAMEWRCLGACVDLGSVSAGQMADDDVITIDEDGQPSKPLAGPIRDAGETACSFCGKPHTNDFACPRCGWKVAA